MVDCLLGKGVEVYPGIKSLRLILSEEGYEIYTSNTSGCLIVAASFGLSDLWMSEYGVDGSLFIQQKNCRCILSRNKHIVASLNDTFFFLDENVLRNFLVTCKSVMASHPDFHLDGSIYIEEFLLLLPSEKTSYEDNNYILGRIFTNGVNCSLDDLETVSKYSPLDGATLSNVAFEFGVKVKTHPQKQISVDTDTVKEKTTSENYNLPEEPFHLSGRPELEQFFNEQIVDVIRNQELYKRMGVGFPGATVLFGPPGCGKTFAVDSFIKYMNWPRFDIDASSIASPYIHDTSKKINAVFADAIKAAPSFIVIDEMDAFLSARSGFNGDVHHTEEIAEFLRRIPEATDHEVLIFGMTNQIDLIDKAILRRGRFDNMIEVQMASAVEIESMLLERFKRIPVAASVNAKELSEKLEEHPLSDVSYVLKEAGRFAIRNKKEEIDNECIEYALGRLPETTKKKKMGFV
ncbi:MAG: ATP-binding protein [Spirochaetales bacterium]|nr:ATP-binding protein [Spirochaetales bacterium]